ncbi:MAG: YfhO family protein [Lachnospiraceae bacterium]|nr:YfhO family protein [Lachnospiraceae bacterium]
MKNIFNKLLNKETFMYLIFGVLTTVVDYLSYCLLRLADVNYMLANIISWVLAVVFAYITNKIFVFNSKKTDKATLFHEIISFFGARVFSLVFSLIFIYATVTLLGMDDLISKIISSIFVIVMNYFFSKKYIFKDNQENSANSQSFIKHNLAHILAFFIPVIILGIIYYLRDVFPFGEEMYLRSDCYHQYAPFHKELWRKITSGESLTYSWNIGLGSNFVALYAYYLASPLNWIIGLVSEKNIVEIMNLFIIVKLGLASFTFSYYLSKRFNTKQLNVATFSIFYALSSYVCAFSWNLMWLDCLLLLPIVVLGIEMLVKEGKYSLYCISLGLCIISNYYIAIMICIFSVLYFGFQLIVNNTNTKGFFTRRIIGFGIHSLLAGGFAACLFIPAFVALSNTASGEFDFPDNLQRYFSILQMLSRSMINIDAAIFEPHDPNIYCTVAVFLLVPIYWFSNKIDIKEKIGKTFFLALLLISFNLNIPNYIWHGFHFPNSLPCRESFIYIFLILTMCYEGLLHIKEISNKQLFGAYGVSLGILLLFEQIFVDNGDYAFTSVYLSILFITFYLFVLMAFRSKSNYYSSIAIYLLFVVIFSEAFINTYLTGFSTTSRTYYMKDNEIIEELLDSVEETDDSFYRIEKYERRTKNDATWHGYRGASIFSSTTNAPISEIYGALGFEESCNAYAYYGHTPLTEALLSIKYILGNELKNDTNLVTMINSKTDNNTTVYLYENKYVLPLGFMVDSAAGNIFDSTSPNPFTCQNSLFTALGGEGELFTRLTVDSSTGVNTITTEEDMHIFVYSTTSCEAINIDVINNGLVSSEHFGSLTHKYILDAGKVSSGSTVTVKSSDNEVSDIQIYAYSFNETAFTNLVESLNQNAMELETFEDTYLKGTVTANEDGLLFTSIPYDKGWTALVDGKEVEIETLEDAFIMVPVSEGTHTIEFKYVPGGFYLGIIISLLSCVAFITILVCTKKLATKKPVSQLTTTE